jgi:beta-lactamase regulating signal transducer with metallopeptidase domain
MSIVVYMLKVSMALVLFYALYRFVFARLTFFHFNRFYILAVSIISFLLPLIKFPVRTEEFGLIDYSIGINWDQIMQVTAITERTEASGSTIQPLSVLLLIYFTISAFRLFRGIRHFLKIRKSYSNGDIQINQGIRLNIHPNVDSPFTMFRTVYLDRYTYEQDNSPVIRHEMIHARELHSLDLLLSEIICAFLWFNPFVFLFKKQMRDNHEFLADRAAHVGENSLITYMQSLSHELTRKYDPAYASYFQSSTLKKRIIMLTNKKSSNSKKWLYLLLIPVLGIMTMAFQQPVENVISDSSVLQMKVGDSNYFTSSDEPGIPSRFPLDEKYKGKISSNFGTKKHPISGKMYKHVAIDIVAPAGTEIYSTARGVVAKSEFVKNYGHLILIKHSDGYATLYAHMNERFVEVGDKVKLGQKIAGVGNTGLSTGPHLHYEVRKDGENLDPVDFY